MKTPLVTIVSNGSGATKPLDALFDALEKHTLDPTFERFGNFLRRNCHGIPGRAELFGNFFDVSHVFNIRIENDPDLVRRFAAAIARNKTTPAYKDAKRVRREQERMLLKMQEEGRRYLAGRGDRP